MRLFVLKTLTIIFLSLITQVTIAQTITNSEEDFSLQQGYKGWYYGYAISTETIFRQMTDTYGQAWIVSGYWTTLTSTLAHPNSTVTSNGRQPVDHRVIRKWKSSITDTINISGKVAKDKICGDGVIASVVVRGTEIWSHSLAAEDSTGTNYSLSVSLQQGDDLDFIIAPKSTDLCDGTIFTAIISNNSTSTSTTPSTNPVCLLQPIGCGAGATFTVTPSSGTAPLTVQLNASLVNAPSGLSAGSIKDYQWTTTTGQTASGSTAFMTFTLPGTHTINLTITDSQGYASTVQKTISVTGTSASAGECVATFSPTTGKLSIPNVAVPVMQPFGGIQTLNYSVEMQQQPNSFTFDLLPNSVKPR